MKLKVRCPFCDTILSSQGFAGHVSGRHPLEWYQMKHEGNDIGHLCDVARDRIRGKSLTFSKVEDKPRDSIDKIVEDLMRRPPKKT